VGQLPADSSARIVSRTQKSETRTGGHPRAMEGYRSVLSKTRIR
jgi:hypothetical protein